MDVSTLAVALGYTKKQIEQAKREGFKVQVEQDRNILETTGEEKIFYFLPKNPQKPKDGYDEFVYANNNWEQVGVTDIDLSDYATKEWVAQQLAEFGKTDISSATVTLSASSFTYDGTSKAPSVTSVVLNGTTLTEGTGYVVFAAPATNAGSYALTVNGIGDYTGTVTANWSIAKAQAVISGDSTITIRENGSPVSKTYISDSDGAFSFSISDNTVASISNNGGTVTVTPLTVSTAAITVTLAEGTNYLGATKTVALTVSQAVTHTVFGVCWDYSLSSPALTRLTPQTDPLGVVTTVPSQEPTACVGNDGNGQSDFDNYMPWAGMQRYNYVNGQVVDFVGYENGETYVYIPEFWSKIVDDSTNSKMYFYISDSEIEGFDKHIGSDRYVGRYVCDNSFKSVTNATPRGSTTLGNFRKGITSIDSNHFQFDIYVYSALILLYTIEWANFNTAQTIGECTDTSNTPDNSGKTDSLLYHTGKIIADSRSNIQYRWIENLYGNMEKWIDGVLIVGNPKKYNLGTNPLTYSDSANADYRDTDLTLLEQSGFSKNIAIFQNTISAITDSSASASTFLCSKYTGGTNGMALYALNRANGLFTFNCDDKPARSIPSLGSRPMLILNIGGNS